MFIILKQVDVDWYFVKAYISPDWETYDYRFEAVISTEDLAQRLNSVFWHFERDIENKGGGNVYISCPDQQSADAIMWAAADYLHPKQFRTFVTSVRRGGHKASLNF